MKLVKCPANGNTPTWANSCKGQYSHIPYRCTKCGVQGHEPVQTKDKA